MAENNTDIKEGGGESALATAGATDISSRMLLALCVALFGIVVWTFSPSLNGEFLYFDEHWHILDNSHVMDGLTLKGVAWAFRSLEAANWHPVTWLSHMLDCEIHGLDPWGHHLTNVLLHALNAVLVFVVLRAMTGTTWRSLVVAVLFAAHPLRVESVAWISERKDVLSLTFWMLATWAYVRYAQQKGSTVAPRPSTLNPSAFAVGYGGTAQPFRLRRWLRRDYATLNYLLALLFFTLGLMSKSSMVTLPCVLLLLDYWPLRRTRFPGVWTRREALGFVRLAAEKIPFVLAAAATATLTLRAQRNAGMMGYLEDLSVGGRVSNALVSYVRYAGHLFWPADLCTLYPHPGQWSVWAVFAAGSVILGAWVMMFRTRRGKPWWLVGGLWYFGTLVPMIGLVQVGPQSMADRYTYIPEIGLLVALVWGVAEAVQHRRALRILAGVAATAAVLVCIPLTRHQIGYWKDGETVWSRALAATGDNYAAHEDLGIVLVEEGRLEEAIPHFEEAVRLRPGFVEARFYLGSTLLRLNRLEESIVHLQEAVRLQPGFESARMNLGIALAKAGRREEAIAEFRELARLYPERLAVRLRLGALLTEQGLRREAAPEYREALRLAPDNVEALNNLAWILATNPDADLRNGAEAVRHAERACELTGYNETLHIGTLAAAYAEAGRFDDAIRTAEKACAMAAEQGNDRLLAKNRELLELYRQGKAYREP